MSDTVHNTPKKIIKIIQSGDYPPAATSAPPTNNHHHHSNNNSGLPSPYPPANTSTSTEPPLLASSAPPTAPFYRFPPAHTQQQQPPSSSSSSIPSGITVIKPTPKVFPKISNPTSPEDPKKAIKGFIQSDSSSSLLSQNKDNKATKKEENPHAKLLSHKLFTGYGIQIVDQVLKLDKYPGDQVKHVQQSTVSLKTAHTSTASASTSTATTAAITTTSKVEEKVEVKHQPIHANQQPLAENKNASSTVVQNADSVPSKSSKSSAGSPMVPSSSGHKQESSPSFTALEKLLVFVNLIIFCGILFSCVVLGRLLLTVHNKEALQFIAWITKQLQ